jgi:hypothetical protein
VERHSLQWKTELRHPRHRVKRTSFFGRSTVHPIKSYTLDLEIEKWATASFLTYRRAG